MTLVEFLDELEGKHASYRLDRVRDSIMVEVWTPGKHWEVEFMDDGSVEVEVFESDGTLFDEVVLPDLLAEFD